MAVQFHDLTIRSIEQTGKDALIFQFDIPAELKQVYHFTPGQYLTLRAFVDGEDLRRAYSICSSANSGTLQVGIKVLQDGKFSNHAILLKAGDKVSVMPAQGRFTAVAGTLKNALLIAAGSGITPVLCIAQSLLEGDGEANVTLIYGNRTTDQIMFRDELDALKDRFMDRFNLIHILSREDQDVPISNGRIDAAKLDLLSQKKIITPSDHDGVYLCGPQEMIETCAAELELLGTAKGNIHFELFTPADGGKIDPAKLRNSQETAADQVQVETILDGSRRTFLMNGKQMKVLDAAHAAGIELPFSCAGGMCCTCRCKIAEGDADMDVNFSLEPWEIEAGFTLACQARPKTKKLVLDFDAS